MILKKHLFGLLLLLHKLTNFIQFYRGMGLSNWITLESVNTDLIGLFWYIHLRQHMPQPVIWLWRKSKEIEIFARFQTLKISWWCLAFNEWKVINNNLPCKYIVSDCLHLLYTIHDISSSCRQSVTDNTQVPQLLVHGKVVFGLVEILEPWISTEVRPSDIAHRGDINVSWFIVWHAETMSGELANCL